MGKRILLIILIGIAIGAQANGNKQEKLDSLESRLTTTTDQIVLTDTYAEIIDHLKNNYQLALTYSTSYIQAAIDTRDSFRIADAYYRIADLYYNNNFDSTLYYTKKYLEASIVTQDTFWIADAYNFVAYAYSQKGDLQNSLNNFQKAFEYFDILGDSMQMASCYINIGYTISFSNKQESSLKYFLKGLRMAEAIKDSSLMSDAYYNVAYYYDRIKDYQASLEVYEKSLTLSLNLPELDSNGIAIIYCDIAHVLLKLNRHDEFNANMLIGKNFAPENQTNYEKCDLYSRYIENYIEYEELDSAEIYLKTLENILNENSFILLEAYTLQQKGRLALLKKNYKNCIKYLNESIRIFEENNSMESFAESYSYIAQAYAALNKYKEAYYWQTKSISYEDSLNLGAVEKVLAEFEQSRIHEIEMQRKRLEMELDQQKLNNSNLRIRTNLRISIGGLILLIVFVIITLLYYRNTRKNNHLLNKKNLLIESQKKLLEAQIITLEDNKNKLQELNATKDKFFSIIAHDLRNPFHSIIGLSKLFLDQEQAPNPNSVLKIIGSMNQTANYGYALLENLLEWSKSQTGRIVPNPEPIEMEQLIRNLIDNFKAIAASKNITLLNNAESTLPVFADKNMVYTIIRNLLHNAIKFSYENSKIYIVTRQETNHLSISITDEGIGISEEDKSKLFSIDKQVRKLGTQKEKGSGLGLILCKEFVEKNNGKISVEGNKDQGCTFSFTLPLA